MSSPDPSSASDSRSSNQISDSNSRSSNQNSNSGASSDSYHYQVPGLHATPSDSPLDSSSDPQSSSNPHTSSDSNKHTTSSSNKSGSSSVTWHETVSVANNRPSDEASDGSRRKSSLFSDEDHQERKENLPRSSLRRFKEGSKIFAGFIEDADGLVPSDDMLPPMTWEEKCEIIEELCLALEKRLERLRSDKGGEIDGLQNYLDVAEHKIGMARKDRVEMQRSVIQFAELLNPTHKPYAEDMVRFLNGRVLEKKLMKEKLEQRNRRLQKMVAATKAQLENKIDVKDLLHDSDIMELNNLNKELGKQLDARSLILNKSRLVSRRIVKLLKVLREDLERKIEAKQSIKQSLLDRSPLVNRFRDLIESEKIETDKISHELLTCVKGEDTRPTALEYMKVKQRTKDLRKELYKWFAKVEIAELTNNELSKHAGIA